MLLDDHRLDQAVEVLKGFETKEKALKARAANNLSCIYMLEASLAPPRRLLKPGPAPCLLPCLGRGRCLLGTPLGPS